MIEPKYDFSKVYLTNGLTATYGGLIIENLQHH